VNDPAGSAAPSLGDLVGSRYRLDELVGTGGMAQVWSATDTVLNRRVAVKILHPHLRTDPTFVERFRQEARSGAQLHHPSVVAVYDTVSAPELEAIVMELVEGETLRARLDRVGALPADAVRHLGVELADALDAAHRVGLTHRDIKPANILLCPDGSLKLADFGIAKDGSSTDLTQDGTLVGTANYLAPEQVEGAAVDGRADQFAVGVVLYEALCGRLPFNGDTETARAVARLHQRPTPPDQLTGAATPAVSAVILRMLERQPDARYPTMAEMAAALDRAFETAASVPPPPAPVTNVRPAVPAAAPRRARRNWVGMTILAMLIGAALLVIVVLVDSGVNTPHATATTSAPAQTGLVPISNVTPFDPEGSGPPGENNAQAGRTFDGNPATSWSTEQYQQRDFGTKSGLGLIVRLDRRVNLTRLDVDSPSIGWSAEVFVLDAGDLPTGAPSGAPTARIDGANGNASADLGGHPGDTVLIWFTELGRGQGSYRIQVSELRVVGQV
jgi:eukaryotic-like serine/threonine-protein kinase